MKKLFLMGTFALLSATLFSCTADEETSDNKSATEVKKELNPETPSYADGPGDDPIIIQPPKKD
ncbi:hypothetical protein D3C85_499240 [compost metagenome]|jgi:hypothetical protein